MSKVKEEAENIINNYDDTFVLVAEENAYVQSKRVLILAEALEDINKLAQVDSVWSAGRIRLVLEEALKCAEEVK